MTNRTDGLDAAGVAGLLPCPFCGGEPSVGTHETESLWSHDIVTYTTVRCSECDIYFSTEPGYEVEAIAAWNRRSALVDAPAGEAVSEDVANFVRERVTNIQRNFTPRSTNRIEAEALLERMEAALASPTPSVAALQAEIERLRGELTEAKDDITRGIEQEQRLQSRILRETSAREAAVAALLPPDTEGEVQPVADESLVERAFDIGRMWNHALTGHVCDARDVARTLQSYLFDGLNIEPWPIDQTSSRDDAVVDAVKAIKAALRLATPRPAVSEAMERPSYDAVKALVNDCVERMKRTGESHPMLARWISEGLTAALSSVPGKGESEHHEFVADPYRPSQCVNCGRHSEARVHDASPKPSDPSSPEGAGR